MESAAATTWPGTLASSTTCIRARPTPTGPSCTRASPTASLTGKISYSNEFGGFSNDSALYYELGAGWELPENFGLNAHIGYSDGDGIDDAYAGNVDDYFDWSVGVTYTLGNFELGLKYVDGSDLEPHDGTPGDISSSEAKAVFSVSTTFPWGSE